MHARQAGTDVILEIGLFLQIAGDQNWSFTFRILSGLGLQFLIKSCTVSQQVLWWPLVFFGQLSMAAANWWLLHSLYLAFEAFHSYRPDNGRVT